MRKDPIELPANRDRSLRPSLSKKPAMTEEIPSRPTSAIDAAFAELDGQLSRVEEVMNQHLASEEGSLQSDDKPGRPQPELTSSRRDDMHDTQRDLFRDISRQLEALDEQREALSRLLQQCVPGNQE